MLKIGLVGLGNQGYEYLLAQPKCTSLNIIAVCDNNKENRDKAIKNRPNLTLTSSIEELRNLHLDGLILALPHHVYKDIWGELVSLGLPILKEKPLGRNLAEARYFIKEAQNHGCPLQTAVQRREHPSYKFLYEKLKETTVNDISFVLNLGFERSKSDKNRWRDDFKKSGGGALLDSGYHMVDLAHFFVGQFDLLSSTIWSDDSLCEPEKIDDAMHIIGRKSNTWIYINSRTFKGENGEFSKEEQVVAYTNDGIFSANRLGVWRGLPEDDDCIYSCEKDWQKAMIKQLNCFAQQINDKSKISAQYWDQLPAQKVIDQAYQMSFNLYGEQHEER